MNPTFSTRLAGLSLSEIARAAAFKGFQRLLTGYEAAAGYLVLRHREQRYARRWLRCWGNSSPGIAHWLSRPAAGLLWLPANAAEWAARTCSAEDLRLATQSAHGRFDLLGSGCVELGRPPAWRRDLYSGVQWPLAPVSKVQVIREDGSDIRTVWELSRSYHFLALARAYWRTGDRKFVDAFVEHAQSWLEQNPIGYGPHWCSPMDVAIRSANWCLAVYLFAQAPIESVAWTRLLANLYASGVFLNRHLEWHPRYRGNHYLADAVGLVYLGALFRGERAGERWLRKGARILLREVEFQTGSDGVALEGSLAYHRLHTELFAYAGELLRLNLSELDLSSYDDRVRRMYRVIDAYVAPSGEAPLLGDGDDGRLHALSAAALLRPRRHQLGLPERHASFDQPASEQFPHGGFYVLRDGDNHAVVRCGAVGLRGAGSHDHNDQLSFELVVTGRSVVSDSGTFAYTRDLRARYDFRATAAHNVIQLGGEEQNPIDVRLPWRVLADRTRSRCLRWINNNAVVEFSGEHHGYAHRASKAVCRRRLRLDRKNSSWLLVDEVSGRGEEDVVWRLHLAPASEVRIRSAGSDSAAIILAGEPDIEIQLAWSPGLQLQLARSRFSEAYGKAVERPLIELRGVVALPLEISVNIAVSAAYMEQRQSRHCYANEA